MRRTCCRALSLTVLLFVAAAARGADDDMTVKPVAADHAARMKAGLELFRRDVRPVLVEHCLECHGGESTKADFDISTRQKLLESGYVGDDARYSKCFASGYYLTGDLARRDADGYFWFVGRADDVIKSSGHLIGPFEIESALLEHPGVAEAAAIGKPDPMAFEVVKAFVALKPGFTASDSLARELVGFARVRLGAAVAPKEIAFVDSVPRNRAGKIMRRLLKARELGLPEGDTSTLEPPS